MRLTQQLFIGRFQPPTIKHTELIEFIFDYQKKNNIDLVIIGIVQGEKSSQKVLDNPFPQTLRKTMLEKIINSINTYGIDYIIDIFKTGYVPDIVKTYSDKGIDIVQFFCGYDRYKGYKDMFDRQGISDVVSIITFDRNMESDENISQTKVRKQLLKNDLDTQKKLTPKQIHDILPELQSYYQEIQKTQSTRSLKKYISEIKHIDEIPIEQFIKWMTNLLYESEPILQSIKYDGIQNITFGYDKGKIYCQRRKGKIQVWEKVEEVPKVPHYNQIRSQFTFFKQWFEENKEEFINAIEPYKDSRFEFEFEILSQFYSNLIKYNIENSKLVYLRPLPQYSDDGINLIELDERLTKLFNKLRKVVTEVKTVQYVVQVNDNEIEVVPKYLTEKWSFDTVEYIDIKKYIDVHRDEIESKLKELNEFLTTKVSDIVTDLDERFDYLTVFDVLTIKLNRVSKKDREILKNLRELLSQMQSEYVKNIKNLLLYYINRVIEQEKREKIEGIVLRKLGVDEDELVKLVDKQTFSEINKYVHSFYEELLEEIAEIKKELIDVLKKSSTLESEVFDELLKVGDIEKIVSSLNPSPRVIQSILSRLKSIIDLCEKQIQELESSQDVIEVNGEVINVSHLKEKIKSSIQFEEYLVQQVLKSSDELFMTKVVQYVAKQLTPEIFEGRKKRKGVTEGGNVFDDTEKVRWDEIDDLMSTLEQEFFRKIGLTKEDYSLLGSQKKKEFSGDIDIGVSIEQFKKLFDFSTYDEQLNIFEQLCLKYFNHVKRSGAVISVKFPFRDKFVQVDFILGNLGYLKQYLYSQYSPEFVENLKISDLEEIEVSNYKGVYRNVLLQNILTNLFEEIITDGEYEYRYQFTVTMNGIYRVVKQRKKGNKTWKVVSKELINDKDLQEGLSDIFGIKINYKDISTFENLLNFMKKLELTPEEIKRILSDFKEFCEKNNYIYPTNLIEDVLGIQV